jgi:hypothetical protein
MKRQRGRNRGGNANGGGNGGKPQHNVNRAFDSNGPDGVKIRGNAQHVFEKYQQLARDASSAGDRVLAEGYLQHAEHYFRVLRAVQPQRPPSDFLGRETFSSGYDIDFEDESNNHFTETETLSEGENQPSEGDSFEARGEQNRDQNRDQNRGDRDWQNRSDRDQNRDRNFNRDQRQRDDRPRDERPRDERSRDERPRDEQRAPREDRVRDDRPREDRTREDRPREERQRDRYPPRADGRFNDRPPREERIREDRDPLAVVEPETTPLTTSEPQLRSQDGALSPAPAFLQQRPERVAETAETPEPRRTRRPRAPRVADGGQTKAETEEV